MVWEHASVRYRSHSGSYAEGAAVYSVMRLPLLATQAAQVQRDDLVYFRNINHGLDTER